MVTFQALIKKKIQQGLTRINVAPGVYGWMKGICKDNAFTVHVTCDFNRRKTSSSSMCISFSPSNPNSQKNFHWAERANQGLVRVWNRK